MFDNLIDYIKDNLIDLPTILTTIFGGGSFVAWITERRKRKIEEDQLGASALESMQNAYDKFTKDALERYTTLEMEFKQLKLEFLKSEDQYLALKKEYNQLKMDYDNLQKEFEEYKKKDAASI